MKKSQIAVSAIIALIIAFFIYKDFAVSTVNVPPKPLSPAPSPSSSIINNYVAQNQSDSLTYKGKDGIDALSLLKQQATITVDNSGLVTTINSRKADGTKHEYWAFYINGTLSNVGPADYKTKDTDTIVWKIEKY